MPIQVLCSGCKARFSVSDQFAGRTGPCPKCKKPIKIPVPEVKSITIHEPEAPVTTSSGSGKIPTAPIVRKEKPISTMAVVFVAAGAAFAMICALLVRLAFKAGEAPTWLLAAAALAVAFPCVLIGYRIARDREIEPHRGRALVVRCLICAAVYAAIWGIRSFVPITMTTDDMWKWLFVGPLFCGVGALAALATLDLDWPAGVAHFSLYMLFTALLRWLAGFPPI